MKNIVIGTTFVDIKGFPYGVFLENGRNDGDINYVHGGVGRNIAENLGRCGLHPLFVSTVDDSPFGSDILNRLQKEGVVTDYIVETANGLGTWLAVFNSEGDVAASMSKRSDLSKMCKVLDQYETEIFRDADNISMEIDMDPEIVDKVFALAGKYRLPVFAVISNMSLALEYHAFSNRIDCLVCNLQEAGMLFSMEEGLKTEEVLNEIREKSRQFPVEKVVVTLGAGGAVYYNKKEENKEKASGWIPPVETEVIDTTGAGDAFFSGVVIGLTEKKSLREACETGAKLASLVIGTKENVCPRRFER